MHASRGYTTLLLAAVIAIVAGACSRERDRNGSQSSKANLCSTAGRCDGTTCGDDGCGGVCPCAQGTQCSLAQRCVEPPACVDSCANAGASCGAVCGHDCGTCPSGQQCFWGHCYSTSAETTCSSCALRLSLVSKQTSGDALTKIVLAIDYSGSPAAPARLADIWVYANAPVQLTRVDPGPALTQAGKQLHVDASTGNPWKTRADRSYQLLALALDNTNPIVSGRVATLEFALNFAGPVPFRLVRHTTLAPDSADNALDSLPYDSALVVTAQ